MEASQEIAYTGNHLQNTQLHSICRSAITRIVLKVRKKAVFLHLVPALFL